MKYKELRMLYIIGILFFIASGGAIYFLVLQNIKKAVIALVLSFIALTTLIARYRMAIYEDYMVVYVYKGIGILPIVIDFENIKEMTLLSKHKIQIEHTMMTKIYIVDAQAFYTECQEKIAVHKQNIIQ